MKRCNYFLKKLNIFIVGIMLFVFSLPYFFTAVKADAEVSYTIENGVCRIFGIGEMEDFSTESTAPWHKDRNSIKSIVIEEGITSIGKLAFFQCENLRSVSFPDSIKKIGDYAFNECSKLRYVYFGKGLETIGKCAFAEDQSIEILRFPEELTAIGSRAFFACSSIYTLNIPSSVTELGEEVFAYCNSLVSVNFQANLSEIPTWTFYGCDKLTQISLSASTMAVADYAFKNCDSLQNIYYEGTEEKAEEVISSITNDISSISFSDFHFENDKESLDATYSGLIIQDDLVYSENREVMQTDNSSAVAIVNKDSSKNDKIISATINATVDNEDGWEDVVSFVKQVDKKIDGEIRIETFVFVLNDFSFNTDIMTELVDINTNITVEKPSSLTSIDFNRIESTENLQESYDFSYSVVENLQPTKNQIKEIGDSKSYNLNFAESVDFDFSPSIFFGDDFFGDVATLYQNVPGKGLEKLQSVVVDENGYASYYLQSTKNTTDYLVAMNVEGIAEQDVIVSTSPSSKNDNKYIDDLFEIEYVVTGVRLFMGMSLFQFFIAVFGVVTALVIAIGIVMFVLYRQKRLELVAQLQHGKANVEEIHKYLNEE